MLTLQKANPGDMTEPAVNVMTQDLSNENVTTLDEYTEKTLKQMRDIPDFPTDQLKVPYFYGLWRSFVIELIFPF